MTRIVYRPILACSTGAITRGPDATGPERLTQWCPDIEASALEVMIYDDWYSRIENIAANIQLLKKPVVAVHAEKSIGPNLVAHGGTLRMSALKSLGTNARFARQIGANLVILHLWGLPDGDAMLDEQIKILPELISIARHEGVELGIEAIPCTASTPLHNLKRVIERDPRARFVLDTEFLAMHGELDVATEADWLWEDHRVMHIHVKDYDGHMLDSTGKRRYLHPGEGAIDFPLWLGRVAERRFQGAIALEATVVDEDGSVDISRLNTSLGYLDQTIRHAWPAI